MSISNVRSRSSSRVNTNRDRIRCFECQIQQIFNNEEEQKLLQMPLTDINQARQSVNTIEAREHLNL